MTARLGLAILATALMALPAAAQEPVVVQKPIRDDISARITVKFHTDKVGMVACTSEQIAAIDERAEHHLTTLSPVLLARVISRKDAPGTVLEIVLDAACYEGGITGLAGYGDEGEDVTLPYEERVGAGEWGPMVQDQQPA